MDKENELLLEPVKEIRKGTTNIVKHKYFVKMFDIAKSL